MNADIIEKARKASSAAVVPDLTDLWLVGRKVPEGYTTFGHVTQTCAMGNGGYHCHVTFYEDDGATEVAEDGERILSFKTLFDDSLCQMAFFRTQEEAQYFLVTMRQFTHELRAAEEIDHVVKH